MSKQYRYPKAPVIGNPITDNARRNAWKELSQFINRDPFTRASNYYLEQPNKLPRKRKKWVLTQTLKLTYSDQTVYQSQVPDGIFYEFAEDDQ